MSSDAVQLGDAEIQQRLQTLSNWTLNIGELQRIFELQSFSSAIFFVNAVAHLAELGEHHPDIQIAYNKVRLNFVTHTAGGITDKDFVMAQKVDELWLTFNWNANI